MLSSMDKIAEKFVNETSQFSRHIDSLMLSNNDTGVSISKQQKIILVAQPYVRLRGFLSQSILVTFLEKAMKGCVFSFNHATFYETKPTHTVIFNGLKPLQKNINKQLFVIVFPWKLQIDKSHSVQQ